MPTTIRLDESLLLGATFAFFALLGWRRGINRELLGMAGILVAIFLATNVAPELRSGVNSFYRLARFALSGGLSGDNPAAAWQNAKSIPDLVQTPAQVRQLSLGVFAVVTLFVYLLGQQNLPDPRGVMPQLLGGLAGGINGFIVAYYLYPLVFSGETVISFPGVAVTNTLASGRTIALALVVFVVILIAFGLYNASGPGKR